MSSSSSGSSNVLLDLHSNLPQETRSLMAVAESWARRRVAPLIAEHWQAGRPFPKKLWQDFVTECPQLVGYTLSKQHGGQGYDLSTQCHITQTFASIDASFTTALLVQYGLAAESIRLCGTPSQQQRWLPRLAHWQCTACFGLTEPQSGSDATDLRTTATRVDEGYLLKGRKRWIGSASQADVLVIWARNTSLPGAPVMGFLVEKSCRDNAQKLDISNIDGKVSLRIVQNAEIDLQDVFCPDENVLGDHVGFAASVGRVLEASRVSVAWIPVGMAQGAVTTTVAHVQERQAFGAALASQQLVQERLVRMTAMVASMYLLVERVTEEFSKGNVGIATISMTKAYNSKLGRDIVGTCRELLGGNGIVLDYGVASKFCDMEAVYTYEGTYDVCTLVAGRALTGVAAITSGEAVKAKARRRSKL